MSPAWPGGAEDNYLCDIADPGWTKIKFSDESTG